jgi:hypothetical protein
LIEKFQILQMKRYTERPKTAYKHAWEIRDAYEYHEYEDAEWSRRFRPFLHGRAWTHAEGPKALFDHAVGWLRRPPTRTTGTAFARALERWTRSAPTGSGG